MAYVIWQIVSQKGSKLSKKPILVARIGQGATITGLWLKFTGK